jgi:uncharacterized protein YhbP (UPF0306 family)
LPVLPFSLKSPFLLDDDVSRFLNVEKTRRNSRFINNVKTQTNVAFINNVKTPSSVRRAKRRQRSLTRQTLNTVFNVKPFPA